MRKPKPRLLAELATERRARIEAEPWVPTEEQKVAIADGTLIAIAIRGLPCILIHLGANQPDRIPTARREAR